jgi:hypothetical protein
MYTNVTTKEINVLKKKEKKKGCIYYFQKGDSEHKIPQRCAQGRILCELHF